MTENVLLVENLSKRFLIQHKGKRSEDGLRHAIQNFVTAPLRAARRARWSSATQNEAGFALRKETAASQEEFWALRDVSFEVKRDDVLGIIGRNGAGKSTLLKLLSRITEPSHGRIGIKGRVASLLEVGTGFHPELTGRENIFLNGAVLGMSRAEVRSKFDEIVAFSEVEKFLDTPVKRYSSGMYVRLAFAVAAHLEPDILIVDEVLAVGDAAFQKKCMGKMKDVGKAGRTVLFVSHNMAAVQNLCTRALLFERGRLVLADTTETVVQRYLASVLSLSNHASLAERTDRSGTGTVRLTDFHLEDLEGNRIGVAVSGMDLVLVLNYEGAPGATLRNVDAGISISNSSGVMLFVLYRSYTGAAFDEIPTRGEFRCSLSRLPLSEGKYSLEARVMVAGVEADWPRDSIGSIDVESGDFYGTGSRGFNGNVPLLVNGEWSVR